VVSEALFQHGGLRFWHEREIRLREHVIAELAAAVRDTLTREWAMYRVEGPILHPRDQISPSYDDGDIFVTNHKGWCLRAETTPSSYAYARWMMKRGAGLPLCIWQAGISSRRETNDGASAAKLRFNSFWQIEFQCIVPLAEKRRDGALRGKLIEACRPVVERVTMADTRVVDSDRLPSYSESTRDIEVRLAKDWREVASCSIRTDFSPDTRVVEMAFGLDRLVTIAGLGETK
jgi:glycyl-tRNA synthetase